MSEKIVKIPDGREFINRGVINPVGDETTAEKMAYKEQEVIDRHEAAVAKMAGEPSSGFVGDLATRKRAERLDEARHASSEAVRGGVASAAMGLGRVELAQKLYHYQEVPPYQPPVAENQQPTPQEVPKA